MKFTNRIKLATNILRGSDKPYNPARDFYRHGSRPLMQDWSQVIISDKDMYTGFMYGALDRRANGAAVIGEHYIKTEAKEDIEHPYLELINKSKTFTNYQFWYSVATYIDLKGVAYLLAVRNFDEERVGEIQEFKILNPYNVKRVINEDTNEVGGYVEGYRGKVREIPTQMVIPIKKLNPFDWLEDFSMADAAKDAQFTLKTSSDYTKHAIQKNQNSPGIITVDDENIALDPNEFQNFKSRILGKQKGEPIFGVGKGAISYDDMMTDLNKVALEKIAEVNINNMIAVTGVSKTKQGIEQSGTTRDTAKVQKDQFIEDQTIPLVQNIIDGLNQDYKNNYDFETTEAKIVIENPLAVNYEAEIKHSESNQKRADLYHGLIERGYDADTAARYVQGEIDVDELGEPEKTEETEETQNKVEVKNDLVETQEASLRNAILSVDERIVATAAKNIQEVKNQFDEDDLLSRSERQEYERELSLVIAAFFGVIIPLYARQVMGERIEEFATPLVNYRFTAAQRDYIRTMANKAASSHTDTLLEELVKVAQSRAGEPVDQIAKAMFDQYRDVISKHRAEAISRTETYRAFNQAQRFADEQFIKSAGFEGKAFKQWVTRGPDPCEFCQQLAAEPPIPFDDAFANIGDVLEFEYEKQDGTTSIRKLPIQYEDLEAGNAHTNCFCRYQLIRRE